MVYGDVFLAVLAQTTGDEAKAQLADKAYAEYAENMSKLFADNVAAAQETKLRQSVKLVVAPDLDSDSRDDAHTQRHAGHRSGWRPSTADRARDVRTAALNTALHGVSVLTG